MVNRNQLKFIILSARANCKRIKSNVLLSKSNFHDFFRISALNQPAHGHLFAFPSFQFFTTLSVFLASGIQRGHPRCMRRVTRSNTLQFALRPGPWASIKHGLRVAISNFRETIGSTKGTRNEKLYWRAWRDKSSRHFRRVLYLKIDEVHERLKRRFCRHKNLTRDGRKE